MSDQLRGYVFETTGEPPPPAQALQPLQAQGLLPAGEIWWFAWRELDICLPGKLERLEDLPDNWDVLHVFSPQVEFRRLRRGRGWLHLLLTEGVRPPAVPAGWRLAQDFATESALRILWGAALQLPDRAGRGVVSFPRTLDYALGEERLQDAVVADVQEYADAQARLQLVRYVRLRHLPSGDHTARVKPTAAAAVHLKSGGPA